ncbi:MAG TPA: PH domain-containing protein [Acidimicrobiales bacterium]|nr:PH domain-containing protein [Acidimicrobiales bacterium]
MAFPKKLLAEGEEVVLYLHPHWWFYVRPVVVLVLAVAGTVTASVLNSPDWLFLVLLGLVGLALLWVVGRLVRWVTTEFVVTTERLVYRSGVLARRGKEIPLERLNDISFNQTLMERMLGSGDLMIESGGEHGQQHFYDISRPARVQHEIYRQREAAAARDHDRMAGRRELSVPEQIEKLDELRQRGVLTQAEFDAKKAQLLDRM